VKEMPIVFFSTDFIIRYLQQLNEKGQSGQDLTGTIIRNPNNNQLRRENNLGFFGSHT
jgi:hypothetical protein